MWTYPLALAAISAAVALLERLVPARPSQPALRQGLWSDVAYLVFNGHFLGVGLALLAAWTLDPLLGARFDLHLASGWPLWLQAVVATVLLDFAQWTIHNLLHRVPWLWEFHKVHHSVRDGEMDWIVSFRFHWVEVVVYKTLQYLPLALMGFAGEALMFHAVFGTLVGHLNHANLDWGHGWWRYVLNSPRMHLWHHDADAVHARNFGIIFSAWDWLFGTAHLPDHPPRRIGFVGQEAMPSDFFRRSLWPLLRISPGDPR
ncbi:MAG: sterol desaturase family protein [Pseudomonadota bacterium]|nr:sterol desaturase family protein [Pseudomonadota bacterium]